MSRRAFVRILVAALLLLLASTVYAQSVPAQPVGIYDSIAQQYAQASNSWQAKLLGYATHLFGLLAVIEMSWAGITYLLDKDDPRSLLTAFTKKLIVIGFFFTLLQNGPAWLNDIITSFSQAGSNAGGAGYVTPSSVAGVGFDCAFRILDSIKQLGFIDTISVGIVAGLCALIVVLAFVMVATQLLVALIESYIVTGAGVLFLGFGASRFTTDFTQKYLAYAVSVGVKLFLIYLIIGTGLSLTNQWSQMLAATTVGTNFLHNALVVAGGGVMFAVICWQVPSFAQALMSGSASLTAGAVGATAAGVLGASVGAVVGAGAAAKGGIDATRAAAEAGQAGVGLAKAGGASGSGALLKGLGHAAGAMAAEGGRALGSSAGATKASAFARDGQGGSVTRLGDRAASRLQSQTEKATAASGSNSPPSPSGGSGPSGSAEPAGGPIGGAPLSGAPADATAGGAGGSPPSGDSATPGSGTANNGVDAPSVSTGAPAATASGSTASMGTAEGQSGTNVSGQAAPAGAPVGAVPLGGAPPDVTNAPQSTASASAAPSSGSSATSATTSQATAQTPSAGTSSSSAGAQQGGAPAAVGLDLPSGATPDPTSLGDRIKAALPPKLPPDTGAGIGSINIALNHGQE